MEFGFRHYVPVLKTKLAEFKVLSEVSGRADVTPLIEVLPGQRDKFILQLEKAWNRNQGLFVDLQYLDPDAWDFDEDPFSESSFETIFWKLRNARFASMPVTGLARSPAYQQAVKSVLSGTEQACCIRLGADDFDRADFSIAVTALLEFVERNSADTHLIIDREAVGNLSVGTLARIYRMHLDDVSAIGSWRTITVVATAFPQTLGDFGVGTHDVERTEWKAWSRLIGADGMPLASFGDYGTAGPLPPPEGIPRGPNPNLRYTLPEDYIVIKSASGTARFPDICRQVVQESWYSGPQFSPGDAEIESKATTADSGPGNASTWRWIGMSHHVQMVRGQLASRLAP